MSAPNETAVFAAEMSDLSHGMQTVLHGDAGWLEKCMLALPAAGRDLPAGKVLYQLCWNGLPKEQGGAFVIWDDWDATQWDPNHHLSMRDRLAAIHACKVPHHLDFQQGRLPSEGRSLPL